MHHRFPTTLRTLMHAAVLIVVMMLGSPLSWGADPTPHPADPSPRSKTLLKRRWGVEVEFVRQTAGGFMIEFRYRVLDAKKAAPLFTDEHKPVLEHARTGAKFVVPSSAKTGALRNSNPPVSGRTYWMVFANPGAYVKPGDRVHIQIGDFRVENIEVE